MWKTLSKSDCFRGWFRYFIPMNAAFTFGYVLFVNTPDRSFWLDYLGTVLVSNILFWMIAFGWIALGKLYNFITD
jgi:hypothetical protein